MACVCFEQVNKIEGVFSGTLSYIFNEYSQGEQGGPSFSSIVQVAKANGYTVSSLRSHRPEWATLQHGSDMTRGTGASPGRRPQWGRRRTQAHDLVAHDTRPARPLTKWTHGRPPDVARARTTARRGRTDIYAEAP